MYIIIMSHVLIVMAQFDDRPCGPICSPAIPKLRNPATNGCFDRLVHRNHNFQIELTT